ncbi:DUF6159 family protein [Lysobacter sp.]|uniref:DUF6159 family protein n=1 Tax=Lysobacter sp. TaxID=72226 RepID=UPI002D39224C|nr:DUF6159 family protein [Lysobacter sp.]HZX76416.1 DUF6159 family protein [Lysobacter sp.]
MIEKFSRSWELVKASAAVLRSDKELMVFPVVSAIAALVVLATFMVPMIGWRVFQHGFGVSGAVWIFLFYFCQYTVIVFFNCALVGAAMIRLEGGDPTLADGLNAAKARLTSILGYAAIAATVGVLLQAMKDKENNFLIRLVGSGLGTAWTLATFLVVPVLVHQQVGPFDALRRSANLLRHTWGENAIGNVGIGFAFGLVSFALIAVGLLLAWLAAQLSVALGVAILIVFVIAVLMLGVYQSALSGIYSAALYRYATEGEAPPQFQGLQLESAFAAR